MNERIEKMMLEATKDIPQGYYVPPQYFEKFAELIVRECASELIRWKDEPFPYDPEFGAKLIRKHFGVEE